MARRKKAKNGATVSRERARAMREHPSSYHGQDRDPLVFPPIEGNCLSAVEVRRLVDFDMTCIMARPVVMPV